jgi:tRNA modification GTPase
VKGWAGKHGGQGAPDCGQDTIAAISTALGAGGIGIVRLSGPKSIALAGRAFRAARGKKIQPDEAFSLLYGHVVDPASGVVLDEALLAVMRKPRSYTCEDVVELHCHGGTAAEGEVGALDVSRPKSIRVGLGAAGH